MLETLCEPHVQSFQAERLFRHREAATGLERGQHRRVGGSTKNQNSKQTCVCNFVEGSENYDAEPSPKQPKADPVARRAVRLPMWKKSRAVRKP